jgi:hypothetical protein
VLKVWLSYWRDVMLTVGNPSVIVSNIDRQESIRNLANKLDLFKAQNIVSSLERLFDLLSRNINPRLAVEVFLLNLPYI